MCLILQILPFHRAPLIYQGSLIIVKVIELFSSSHIKNSGLSLKIMFLINTIITQITHRTFKLISNNSLFWNSTHISKVGISFYSKIKILTKVLKLPPKDNHINYRWYFVYFVMSAFFKLLFFLNKYPKLLCFFKICIIS